MKPECIWCGTISNNFKDAVLHQCHPKKIIKCWYCRKRPELKASPAGYIFVCDCSRVHETGCHNPPSDLEIESMVKNYNEKQINITSSIA